MQLKLLILPLFILSSKLFASNTAPLTFSLSPQAQTVFKEIVSQKGGLNNGAMAHCSPNNILALSTAKKFILLFEDGSTLESPEETPYNNYNDANLNITFSQHCSHVLVIGDHYKAFLFDIKNKTKKFLSDDELINGSQDIAYSNYYQRPQWIGETLYLKTNSKGMTSKIFKYDVLTNSWEDILAYDKLDAFFVDSSKNLLYFCTYAFNKPDSTVFKITLHKMNLKTRSESIVGDFLSKSMGIKFISPLALAFSDSLNTMENMYSIKILSLENLENIATLPNGYGFWPLDDEKLIYQKGEGAGENSLFMYNLRSGMNEKILPNLDLGTQKVLSVFDKSILVELVSSLHGTQYFFSDLKAPEAQLIYSPRIVPDELRTQRHYIQSTDGFTYPAFLYLPPGDAPKTILIYVHGGGCYVSSTFFAGWYGIIPELPFLIKKNYGVLAINYRNSKFIEPSYHKRSLTNEECGKKDVEDIFAAQKYLKNIMPETPLFLWGHSQGGYLVNLASTMYADQLQVRGTISGAGMWTFNTNIKPFSQMGEKDNPYNPNRMPLSYIKNLHVPFLLFHGQIDEAVNIGHANIFLENAYALNKNVKSFLPAHQTHHIDIKSQDWNTWLNMLYQFIEENL